MRRTRVAVIGLGIIGRSVWLPLLLARPDFDVVAVVDGEPVVRHSARRIAPAARTHASWRELGPENVDIAVVAISAAARCEVAAGLLAKGIAVLVETPVCLNSAEAERLARAEQGSGTVLLAAGFAEYRTDIRMLREQLAALGPVRHIELAGVRARGTAMFDGGVLADFGWYLLDLLDHLLGAMVFDEVVGAASMSPGVRTAWQFGQRYPVVVDGEETVHGFLISRNDVSVSLRARMAAPGTRDVMSVDVECGAGNVALRSTYDGSRRSALVVTRGGERRAIPLHPQRIDAVRRAQLDAISGSLFEPGSRGRAIAKAGNIIAVLERLRESARNRSLAA